MLEYRKRSIGLVRSFCLLPKTNSPNVVSLFLSNKKKIQIYLKLILKIKLRLKNIT